MSDVLRDSIREIDAALAIREGLKRLTDDDDAIRDTLEGETDLPTVISRLIESIEGDEGLKEGAKEAAARIKARAERFERRIEAKRALIQQAIEIADMKTPLELPAGTVSLSKGSPKLVITDEAAIPAEYWKASEPTLNRTAVTAALKAKTAVPGATLSNGQPTLTIRIA